MKSYDQIDLYKGWPSPDLLPPSLLLQAAQQVLSNPAVSTPSLLYGPDPGYQPLRKALAIWLSDYYSTPWTVANRICVTGGASQNLSCILQVYTDPSYTKNVYMTAPTYYLACRIFEDNGFIGRLRAIPEDNEGLDVSYLERRLSEAEQHENGCVAPTKKCLPSQKHFKHIIYTVPTFSNPSSKIMTLSRRQQLVRLARKYDALIISDDVYDQLHWNNSEGATLPHITPAAILPRLVDIDHSLDGGPPTTFGNTVSNGSFSKILGPGVRTGWAESTHAFIHGLSQCGSTISGGAPSQLLASIISEMLRAGSLQMHISQTLIPAYRKRRNAAVAAVKQHLCTLGAKMDGSFAQSGTLMTGDFGGGYFLFVHLPAPLLANQVAFRASQENVIVASGELFQVHGDEATQPSNRSIRICFAWEAEHLIVEGIRRLGKIVGDMLNEAV